MRPPHPDGASATSEAPRGSLPTARSRVGCPRHALRQRERPSLPARAVGCGATRRARTRLPESSGGAATASLMPGAAPLGRTSAATRAGAGAVARRKAAHAMSLAATAASCLAPGKDP